MAVMGNYCKAYPVARFREFPGWSEQPAPQEPPAADSPDEAEQEPIEPYYFLQENFVVTRDILKHEGIVFDQVTPEWMAFCKSSGSRCPSTPRRRRRWRRPHHRRERGHSDGGTAARSGATEP